jgi:hypothetical protein
LKEGEKTRAEDNQCKKVKFLKYTFLLALIILISKVVISEINYHNRLRYDSWYKMRDAIANMDAFLVLMYLDEGVLPVLSFVGKFEPEILQSRAADMGERYRYLWTPLNIKTSNVIVSCDLRTGNLFIGMSDIHASALSSNQIESMVIPYRYYNNVVRYYGDIYKAPYTGGDTILKYSFSLGSEDIAILRRYIELSSILNKI